MESGTIARNAKAAKLSDVMLNEMDYAARIGYQGEMICAGRRTEDALIARGMITYEYNDTTFATRKLGYRNPVLTVAGWAVVCPEGRPADVRRMTLDEAWDDAHPVAWSVAVDFDTRLELASVGMDVLLSNITDRPDETAPLVVAVIDEAAELLEAETAAQPAFAPNAVLKAAGDVIRVRGWAQGVLMDHQGCVCALGAIRAAAGNVLGAFEAEEELLRRIHATPEWKNLGISSWNDRLDRTEDQVLSFMY